MDSCIFCEIVAGRAPASRVAENDVALAILDINPFAEGHCLVMPKRHVTFWHDLSEKEVPEFFLLAHQVALRMKKAYDPDFVAIHVRGRRVAHAHLLLIPSYPDDILDRHFQDLERVQENSEALAALRTPEALARAAAKLRSVE